MISEKIFLSQQDTIFFVKPEEIIFCQSDSCYTHVHLTSGKRILIVKSLTKFQKELPSKHFLRVNQSFLINKQFVQSIDKKKRCIELETDHVIPFTVSLKELLVMMGKVAVAILFPFMNLFASCFL